jgi:hypothetical protein
LTVTAEVAPTPTVRLQKTSRTLSHQGAIAALTLCVLLVHGYHPFTEDGGLYVASVEASLNPALFPHDLAFATATLHYSLFAPIMAQLVRGLHVPLAWLLLLTYIAGIWLMLYAASRIASQCFRSEPARLCAVALLAAWFTLPIAGTSLLLMDPYVTARTLSTPLSLLAIGFALSFEWEWEWRSRASLLYCGPCLAAAAALHPLMAAYAAGLVAALLVAKLPTRRAQILGWIALTASALLTAGVLQAAAPAESAATIAAAFSRYYWFLSQWHWFEWLGLAGPLIVFALLLRFSADHSSRILCRASIAVGSIATLISLLFAYESFSTHLVARLQPLRAFLIPYAIMIVLLGGNLPAICRRGPRTLRVALPPLLLATVACVMLLQRQTYPASQHLELPWRAPANPWSQAFLWARENTSPDALFALDANYINTRGEDGQNFRATAQRSMIPDFSKDGGEAAIKPALAAAWFAGMTAQQNLSGLDDAQRDARLRPLQVSWMLLHSESKTTHRCPYDNGTVKLCTLD